jgi:hypothetical protein
MNVHSVRDAPAGVQLEGTRRSLDDEDDSDHGRDGGDRAARCPRARATRQLDGSPYAPIVAQAERFRARFESQSAGPEVTSAAIAHAALASRPRLRYVVPKASALLLFTLSLLPTRLIDAIMRAASGLTRRKLARSEPAREGVSTAA